MSVGQSSGTPSIYYGLEVVTFQPGSTPAAPASNPITLGDIWLYSVNVKVPPGPGGCMGFQITHSGQSFLPWGNASTFLLLDSEEVDFSVGTEIAGTMKVVGYNQGFWPHTIYLRFEYTPIVTIMPTDAVTSLVELD